MSGDDRQQGCHDVGVCITWPVAWAATMNPTKATMASLAFLISFVCSSCIRKVQERKVSAQW